MTVEFVPKLTGDLADQAWKTYYEAFAPLAYLAVQRHLMTREEFDVVAGDERIDKVLTYDEAGDLVGTATFTRHLDAVPLLSGAYFQHHFPTQYAQRRIWYIPFVGVAERARKSSAFIDAFNCYFDTACAADGMVGLDICTHNEMVHKLPKAIALQVRRLSAGRSKVRRIDSQHYWLYDMTGNNLTGSDKL